MFISFALKIKRKIFESSEFGLALNTFDRKHIFLNCEDWDNMVLS